MQISSKYNLLSSDLLDHSNDIGILFLCYRSHLWFKKMKLALGVLLAVFFGVASAVSVSKLFADEWNLFKVLFFLSIEFSYLNSLVNC